MLLERRSVMAGKSHKGRHVRVALGGAASAARGEIATAAGYTGVSQSKVRSELREGRSLPALAIGLANLRSPQAPVPVTRPYAAEPSDSDLRAHFMPRKGAVLASPEAAS